MGTLRIEPYKPKSKGAKALSKHIGVLRATDRQVRKHGTFDTIINWGSSVRRFENARYINDPQAVAIAANKLDSYRRLGEAHVPQPAYTTERACAEKWLQHSAVLCRTILNGCGGNGITIHTGGAQPHDSNVGSEWASDDMGESGRDDGDGGGVREGRGGGGVLRGLPVAKVYTKYEKKQDEYRVHVFMGRVIDIQHKRKRLEVPNEDVNYQIRNAANGWVFCRDDVACPPIVISSAIRAVGALGLDFGAADVGYNALRGCAHIYEVNTAPGLEGTTLDRYMDAIASVLPEIQGGRYAYRRAHGL